MVLRVHTRPGVVVGVVVVGVVEFVQRPPEGFWSHTRWSTGLGPGSISYRCIENNVQGFQATFILKQT